MRRVFCIFILLISSFSISQTRVPNTSILSNSGEFVNIKEFTKDKTVVILFWATWCVPCINELNNINEVYSEWQKETNLTILAVSIDDSRTISRVMPLVKSNDWTYKVLFDNNQELKRAFNVLNIPYQIIIHNNKILYRHSGYTEGQEKDIIEKITQN